MPWTFTTISSFNFPNNLINSLSYIVRMGELIFNELMLFADVYRPRTEKATATHSSTLAWKIPWTEEPGRLQFMGLLRVRHDWVTSLSLFTFMHWRRKWQPTPVFLPGESQGQRSLVVCRLWHQSQTQLKRLSSSSIVLPQSLELKQWAANVPFL